MNALALSLMISGARGAGGEPAPDETPNAFTFTDVPNAALSTLYESDEITVSGLGDGVSVPVTVAGATYSKQTGGIGDWSAYTSASGIAENDDKFMVRHTSSANYETATNTTLTIGGVSDTFTTTTLAEAAPPEGFAFVTHNAESVTHDGEPVYAPA